MTHGGARGRILIGVFGRRKGVGARMPLGALSSSRCLEGAAKAAGASQLQLALEGRLGMRHVEIGKMRRGGGADNDRPE